MAHKRLTQIIPSAIGLLLFGVSIWALAQELHEYPPRVLWQSLWVIPPVQVLLALGATCLNYVAISSYDALAIRYIRHPLPYAQTALAGGVSTAIGNSAGLSLLTNVATRYRFYSSWGLSAVEIASLTAFCHISFWLGLLTVGGLAFLFQPIMALPASLHLPFHSVRPLGAVFLAIIVGYLVGNAFSQRSWKIGKWVFPHLPIPLSFGQVAIASCDWLLAAAALYLLLPPTISISYPGFLSLFLLAQVAGIWSNVPGGLGVFETVMLVLLSHTITSSTLFGILLVYRGIYYLLPLAIAALLFAGHEWWQRWSDR
jgi:uncharacterized membrane protein YbhN (UPF0104 family)